MFRSYDVAIIGGGFFGGIIGQRLGQRRARVVLLEREADLLQRASYGNQARVHNGYHYPRSLVTALRSRINYPRFLADYRDCIDRTFQKYYAIARQFSKVTAGFFELFCRRIGAPVAPAPEAVRRLFDPETIEEVFSVEEAAFNAVKLKERVRQDLWDAGVEVRLNTPVRRLKPTSQGGLLLECDSADGPVTLMADQVFNCTYARMNQVLTASGLPPVPLKHEWAELALIEVPEPLTKLGITVMCGPFFSCMPFPARGLHSLSHVRYTPHCAWQEDPNQPGQTPAAPERSNFPWMVRDAVRYLPLLGECRYRESIWEVKTVLPASETNDSRPILFQRSVGFPNLHCVLGAKLDNIYDVLEAIDEVMENRRIAA